MNMRTFSVHRSAFIVLVFLAVRVVLLYARDPFFDELFTVWMARQPFGRIIQNLLHDSGPPLYYFIARFDSVIALRWLSLVVAAMQFALVVRRSVLAALLLAVYPPAMLFAVDARAYVLCALFVTAGVMALEEEKPYLAALAFVLAAHAHYYGVLFFPLLLSGAPRDLARRTAAEVGRRSTAFIMAMVLFIPGFILAFHQPIEAVKWNRESLFAPLTNLSFAGMYPYALFARPPLLLIVAALAVLIVCGAADFGGARGRSHTFALAVLIPLALVLVFHIAGRPVYFPMRFEAVIAGPLVLWLANSIEQYPPRWRNVLAGAILVIGVVAIYLGIIDHLRRPLDPYRQAAIVLKRVAPREVVVATGYCYLETVVALNRPVIAWPADQAEHPGWRSTTKPDPMALPGSFVWIGERYAPELPALRGVKTLRLLFWNERALIARASSLTPPVH